MAKNTDKMRGCFTSHVAMHSLFGLGLGLFMAAFFPQLASVWVGFVVMLAAVVADAMKKG